MAVKTRGALILIEGLDRTGKSTQIALLESRLKSLDKPVFSTKFPERSTPIGKLINSYLVDKSFHLPDEAVQLLFTANRWELRDTIVSHLNEGHTVIMDRYGYSGVAYSAAKGLDFDWCLAAEKGLPKPDLTIFLTLKDDADLVNREGYGEERYEVKSFQDKVKAQFELAPKKFNCLWEVVQVDGKGIEEVGEQVWSLVAKWVDGTEKELETI